MLAPKCHKCQTAHWSGQKCSTLGDGVSLTMVRHPNQQIKTKVSRSLSASSLEVIEIELPDKFKPVERKPKYDRNEAHRKYMKEYMKLKRASDKLKKGTKP